MSKINTIVSTLLIVCCSSGVGMLLTRGMQVQLNRAEKEVCDAVHPRRLISITTVVGDAYYCVPLHVFSK